MREAEAMRFPRRKTLAGKHVAARLLFADRAHDVRADHRGHQADPHLGQAELGLLGRDHQVAGGNQAHAAGEGSAVHARDERLWKSVYAVEQFREAAGLGLRPRPGHLRSLLHSGQVTSRAERLPPAGENNNPAGGIFFQLLE